MRKSYPIKQNGNSLLNRSFAYFGHSLVRTDEFHKKISSPSSKNDHQNQNFLESLNKQIVIFNERIRR